MDYSNELINMIGALFIVLALILFLLYLIRHFKLTPFNKSRVPLIRLISTLNLAPKRGIAIVEVCDQWLVIGIGAENVNLISRFDRPSEAEESETESPIFGGRFHSILRNISLKQSDPKGEVEAGNNEKV
ncbi:MAG: flagellar biosynthetic protein FliO [Deltaproteobacteria bacterium]|nr:flagellar biosynthetic protein FliO [Deltaproteobacteria bacterium]MBW1914975.1 flagellar biosynthetic protein FliO [Deltaproteobacteria bacterium]